MVKTTIKSGKDNLYSMEQSLKALNGRKVNVGHLDGGEQAWLAAIHEYGCDIEITPKMRVWLHANGLHVKKSTTHIHIPERSFLRSGFDENHEKVIDKCRSALKKSLDSGDAEIYLEAVGLLLRDAIVDYAVELKEPPKHPFSIEMNPSKTNPLIISGDMIEALTYEVE